jgi:hypothetical protein
LIEQRRTQLVKCRKWQFHLGLHPHNPRDPKARHGSQDVFNQRRLSHPRLAMQHQDFAMAAPDILKTAKKLLALTLSPT